MKLFIKKLLNNRIVSFFIRGLKKISRGLNFIINTALLLIVYIFGVGLTWLFAKILKKHFLEMQPSKNRQTYWSDAELRGSDVSDYYRQF